MPGLAAGCCLEQSSGGNGEMQLARLWLLYYLPAVLPLVLTSYFGNLLQQKPACRFATKYQQPHVSFNWTIFHVSHVWYGPSTNTSLQSVNIIVE